jgi:Bacterial protein of unknown function (DUF885)
VNALIRLVACSLALAAATAHADDLLRLDQDVASFRAREQPFSEDDIPRIERPADFTVDWSPAAITRYRATVRGFEARWQALTPGRDAPRSQIVDHRLIGAAIARARFELDVTRPWQRHPGFYIDQTLGSVYVPLLPPPPFDAPRIDTVLRRLEAIPATLRAARANLTDIRRPFLDLATDALKDIPTRLEHFETAFAPHVPAKDHTRLHKDLAIASRELLDYREWLLEHREKARPDTAIGLAAYRYFLHDVALLPYEPETLLSLARAEWSRAVSFESLEANRRKTLPPAPIFPTSDAQVAAEAVDEAAVRRFLVEQDLLTVPADLPHYRNQLLPDYLAPLAFLGVSDDLTGPSRLTEDATSYIRTPRPDLPYFYLSTARDPRPIIVHEGVPGHYFQLALGWRHPDPIRRRYYDSATNEGIGFYAEEMMLQAGLFDDRPQTRTTIYNFMRLRALRVEVDVRLALGLYTLEQAADYLEHTVPMDRATALEEAASFAATPGQAISYQIGKTQILALLADARRHDGAAFSLKTFHDQLWREGNVPFALRRFELFGDESEIPALLPLPEGLP